MIVTSYDYNSETGEFNYVVEIIDSSGASGSGIQLTPSDLSEIVEKTLEDEGIDEYEQGSTKTTNTSKVVQQLIEEIEKTGVTVVEYSYDPDTGDFSYVVEIIGTPDAVVASGSGQKKGVGLGDIMSNVISSSLETQGVEDYQQGEGTSTTTDSIVQQLIAEIEKSGMNNLKLPFQFLQFPR